MIYYIYTSFILYYIILYYIIIYYIILYIYIVYILYIYIVYTLYISYIKYIVYTLYISYIKYIVYIIYMYIYIYCTMCIYILYTIYYTIYYMVYYICDILYIYIIYYIYYILDIILYYIYDIWYIIYYIWYIIYCIWYMIYYIWYMIYDILYIIYIMYIYIYIWWYFHQCWNHQPVILQMVYTHRPLCLVWAKEQAPASSNRGEWWQLGPWYRCLGRSVLDWVKPPKSVVVSHRICQLLGTTGLSFFCGLPVRSIGLNWICFGYHFHCHTRGTVYRHTLLLGKLKRSKLRVFNHQEWLEMISGYIDNDRYSIYIYISI